MSPAGISAVSVKLGSSEDVSNRFSPGLFTLLRDVVDILWYTRAG